MVFGTEFHAATLTGPYGNIVTRLTSSPWSTSSPDSKLPEPWQPAGTLAIDGLRPKTHLGLGAAGLAQKDCGVYRRGPNNYQHCGPISLKVPEYSLITSRMPQYDIGSCFGPHITKRRLSAWKLFALLPLSGPAQVGIPNRAIVTWTSNVPKQMALRPSLLASGPLFLGTLDLQRLFILGSRPLFWTSEVQALICSTTAELGPWC